VEGSGREEKMKEGSEGDPSDSDRDLAQVSTATGVTGQRIKKGKGTIPSLNLEYQTRSFPTDA